MRRLWSIPTRIWSLDFPLYFPFIEKSLMIWGILEILNRNFTYFVTGNPGWMPLPLMFWDIKVPLILPYSNWPILAWLIVNVIFAFGFWYSVRYTYTGGDRILGNRDPVWNPLVYVFGMLFWLHNMFTTFLPFTLVSLLAN